MGIERRKYWRAQCELFIKYSIVNAKEVGDVLENRQSIILDIGMDGVAFPVDHPVNIHDVFDLEISLPKPPPIKVKGGINRAMKVEEAYLLGVHFLDIKDEDKERIKDFVLTKASDGMPRLLDKFFFKKR